MARGSALKVVSKCHKATPCQKPPCPSKLHKMVKSRKKYYKPSEKKEWDDAACPVCLEYPHNAVLLLCSSHSQGCRPYMCATSNRFSDCLEQYKKAYTKVTEIQCSEQQNGSVDNLASSAGLVSPSEKKEIAELLCPLCRGQVKGWTIVERARKYFNHKKRTCMEDNCSYVGNYKELKKHVKAEHPRARPRAVDPVLEEKWKRLEREREQRDVISTVVSSTPGAFVLGDYVIEPPPRSHYRDYNVDSLGFANDSFFSSDPFDLGQNGTSRGRIRRYYVSTNEEDFGLGNSLPAGFAVAPSRSLRRILLGRSRRRRRHRETNEDGNS